MTQADLKLMEFADLVGWNEDDHLAAFQAFLKTAARAQSKPFKTRALGIDGNALRQIGALALQKPDLSSDQCKTFFEEHFTPHEICIDKATGHLTGYYEPVVAASPVKTDRYQTPLLARPRDLIDLDDTNRPDNLPEDMRFGRLKSDGSICAYFTRAEIEGDNLHNGVLSDQGLEICWIEDPMDAYFVHIQGSARLAMVDGQLGSKEKRVTFAAKAGHDYTSIGKELLADGKLTADNLTMASLRNWFKENPNLRTEITWRNKSYIFFEEVDIENPNDGPIAAAKVPLSAGRSMAVDRLLHTYGTPVWIDVDGSPLGFEHTIQRLMIAQDTGSAIVGAARGDFYVGSGDEAGRIAGAINHNARFIVFMPNPYAPARTPAGGL